MIALFLLISNAFGAEVYTNKKVDPDRLAIELSSATINVESMSCWSKGDLTGYCTIRVSEEDMVKNPQQIIQAHVYRDNVLIRKNLFKELVLLEAKLDDGTITAAELRRVVKLMLRLLRISRDD